jgi:hypothetical protein
MARTGSGLPTAAPIRAGDDRDPGPGLRVGREGRSGRPLHTPSREPAENTTVTHPVAARSGLRPSRRSRRARKPGTATRTQNNKRSPGPSRCAHNPRVANNSPATAAITPSWVADTVHGSAQPPTRPMRIGCRRAWV